MSGGRRQVAAGVSGLELRRILHLTWLSLESEGFLYIPGINPSLLFPCLPSFLPPTPLPPYLSDFLTLFL